MSWRIWVWHTVVLAWARALAERREHDRHEQCDDGDDNQNLDQRKRGPVGPAFPHAI
jgi:hypothetical protein